MNKTQFSSLMILCILVACAPNDSLLSRELETALVLPTLKVSAKTPTSTPELANIQQEYPSPLIVIGNTNITNNFDSIKSEPAPCQPEYFDPKVSKFYKVQQNGIPSELYEIQGFDHGGMMIDGWYKEGEGRITLPSPFSVTYYEFGCASDSSYVLDLSKNEVRQSLYTHVLNFSFSQDGKYLFLVNSINNQGNWTLHKRIINIETKAENEIPNIEWIAESEGFWQGERLLTYTYMEEEPDYKTDIYVWDKSANLISRVIASTAWRAASRYYLAEQIGLLPNDPDLLYAYTSKDDNICSLFLIDITKVDSLWSVDILDKRDYLYSYYCRDPEVEFDFSNTSESDNIIRYRILGEWKTTFLK